MFPAHLLWGGLEKLILKSILCPVHRWAGKTYTEMFFLVINQPCYMRMLFSHLSLSRMGFLLPRASCPLGPRAALYGPWGHDALGGENPFCLGIRYENTPFLWSLFRKETFVTFIAHNFYRHENDQLKTYEKCAITPWKDKIICSVSIHQNMKFSIVALYWF